MPITETDLKNANMPLYEAQANCRLGKEVLRDNYNFKEAPFTYALFYLLSAVEDIAAALEEGK